MTRQCSIPGCSSLARRRGWCTKHYHRWRAHGDPLKLLTAAQGELRDYLDNVVMAYEGDECLMWPFSRDSHGYGALRFEGRTCKVHRVVCELVNGPPASPNMHAAHSCGRGAEGCCTKRHLSWKTHAENMADTVLHGTSRAGERNPLAKLTSAQVAEILELNGTVTQRALARQFAVSQATISRVVLRRNWTSVVP